MYIIRKKIITIAIFMMTALAVVAEEVADNVDVIDVVNNAGADAPAVVDDVADNVNESLDNGGNISDNVVITEDMIDEETQRYFQERDSVIVAEETVITEETVISEETVITEETVIVEETVIMHDTVITIEEIVEEIIEYVEEEELKEQELEHTFDYSPFEDIASVDGVNRFVFYASGRQEFQVVIGEISSLGLRFELGFRDTTSGLFLTADFGGGVNYYGGGVNVGYLFGGNDANNFQMLLGMSLGYHITELVVRTEDQTGHYTSRHVGRNTALWGPYIRFFPGNTGMIDITISAMFGYRENSAWYNSARGLYYKDGSTTTLSVSIGYDLPKILTRAWRSDTW